MVQHPDHGDQVDALAGEVQARGVHQALFDAWMTGKEGARKLKLLTARVHQRDLVRVFGQHDAQPPVTAADVDGAAEPSPVEQPADRDDLGLVLVIPASPIVLVVKVRIIVKCRLWIDTCRHLNDPPATRSPERSHVYQASNSFASSFRYSRMGQSGLSGTQAHQWQGRARAPRQ